MFTKNPLMIEDMNNLRRCTLGTCMIAVVIPLLLLCCESPKKAKREKADESGIPDAWNNSINENASEMLTKGKAVFRFETFGDETFWTDKLQLHRAIADKGAGGVGRRTNTESCVGGRVKSRSRRIARSN
jgi:hypothetical protein